MSTLFQIAAIVLLMAHCVALGAALLVALTGPLARQTVALPPWMTIFSAFVSGPIAWTVAPRLRAEFKRQRRVGAVWRH